MVELEAPGPGGDDARAAGGQLAAAGDEVGVQVGLDRMRDGQPAPAGQVQVRGGVPAGVDHHRTPVAQLDQVGAVAQALVDDRVDDGVHVAHGPLLAASGRCPSSTVPMISGG
jgi:hypothetical protein